MDGKTELANLSDIKSFQFGVNGFPIFQFIKKRTLKNNYNYS